MKLFLTFFLLFFSACSVKNYEHTKSKIIIIKSPKLKFGDLGYIRNTNKAVELELFEAGNSVMKIEINHLVCVLEGCMSKSGFNTNYLYDGYPDDILQNILLAKPIYDGLDVEKNKDGFVQKIKNKNVDILYRVSAHTTYFKDRKNKIFFKIKDTNE